MNTIKAIHLLVLGVTLPLVAGAAEKGTSWAGTLTSVREAKTITVSDALQTRTFELSPDCAIITGDNKAGTLNDLQPGEQVVIRYQRENGELVADSISEKVLRYTGSVRSIDSKDGLVTVETKSVWGLIGTARTFRLDESCEVTLHGGKSGTLVNVKPGDTVTILYELQNGAPVAYRVEDPD